MIEIEISEDNANEIKGKIKQAILKGLEMVGMQAEGYAQDLCPKDTGHLSNSITHKVVSSEKAVYIGTNVEYAPYVELGTGKYYSGGRQTPWFYVDDKGVGHFTHGQRPQPYLKPAAEKHKDEYRKIIEDQLKNG